MESTRGHPQRRKAGEEEKCAFFCWSRHGTQSTLPVPRDHHPNNAAGSVSTQPAYFTSDKAMLPIICSDVAEILSIVSHCLWWHS